MRKPVNLLLPLLLAVGLVIAACGSSDPTATTPPAETMAPTMAPTTAPTMAPTMAPTEPSQPGSTAAPPTAVPAATARPAPPATPTLVPTPQINYPERAITYIVPSTPGGSFDTLSRAMVRSFSEILGVPVVIKNDPSGGGLVAEKQIYDSGPEGYTIGMVDVVGKLGLNLVQDLPYNPSALQYIGRINAGFNAMATGINSPYATLEDLQNTVESVRCANILGFSTVTIQCVILTQALGIPMTIVNFPGPIEAIQGVIRGDADISPLGLALWLGFIEAEQARALLVWGPETDPRLPEVPALDAVGLQHLAPFMVQRAVAASPELPPERLQILRDALERAIAGPEFQAFLDQRQFEKNFMRGNEFQALVQNELLPLLNENIDVLREIASGG
jgi:tripartite-type tricarboxylate transporter receptor subunit TctC